jgi:hypothetical protein
LPFPRITRRSAVAAAAVAAVVGLTLPQPASAGSTSIADGSGVDYATCTTHDGSPSVGGADRYRPGSGCDVGESVDLTNGTSGSASGLSFANGQLTATWHVAGPIPAAGSTNLAAADLPGSNFVGLNLYAMFNNKSVQTNVPTNPAGGCTRVGVGNQVLDAHGSWKDGYQFFVAFSVSWDGQKWVQSAELGEYDPNPDGGFTFNELGTNNGFGGWQAANTYHPFSSTAAADNFFVSVSGSDVTVTVPGILKTPDTVNCQEGFFKSVYAKAGDNIANVKALTTANEVVTLPVTVPLSITCDLIGDIDCENDLTSVGGFLFFSDVTDGDSRVGLAGSASGDLATTPCYNEGLRGNVPCIAYTDGGGGLVDTLGAGPTCPTPTFGGLLPTNPLFTPDTACLIDDDSIDRGSVTGEWWSTPHGFIA